METKHTPGPWEVDLGKWCALTNDAVGEEPAKLRVLTGFGGLAVKRGGTVPRGDRYRICGVGTGRRQPDADDMANARLIAAAPDLLEALEGMLSPKVGVLTVAIARAAISKATGEG
jgi:hypothetical protein